MNCTDLKQHLMPFADGELEPALAAEVEKSLVDCPECREELAEIRRISAVSRHAFLAPVEAVSLAGVYDGVMARLKAEGALAGDTAAQPSLWARFTKWCAEVVRFEHPMALAGAAAAIVALVVGLSLSSGGSGKTSLPGVAPSSGVAKVDEHPGQRRGSEEEVKAMGRNMAYVDHIETQKGKAYVEFDKDDPEAPLVLWHVVDEDGIPDPKGL